MPDSNQPSKSGILKGFVEVNSLQNNAAYSISKIGELSTWGLTYTKDRIESLNINFPGLSLTTFNYTDSIEGRKEPSNILVEEILKIIQLALVYTSINSLPYDIDHFRQSLSADAFNIASNLKIGPLETNGTIQLPIWISWTSLEEENVSVKIWLSDQAFCEQYDLYDIIVVPPLSNVDDFFKTPNQVKSELAALTISQMIDNIQTAKSRNPETYIRTLTFNYVSPVLGQDPIPTNWSVLIYGMHGDNIDSIKEALQNHILSHSTHTREDWELIFPDIFKNTEFVILPRWDQMAIPDLSVQEGIYGSVTVPSEISNFASKNIPFYNVNWTKDNVISIPFPYKCLTLNIVAGPNNVEKNNSFSKIFGDYLPVGTSSLDFNRMVNKTQEWMLLVEKMLIIAENFDQFLTVEEPIRVIVRNNITYLSIYFEEVEYLVAMKGSYVN